MLSRSNMNRRAMSPYITTKNKNAGEHSHNVAQTKSRLLILTNTMIGIGVVGLLIGYLASLNTVVGRGYAVRALEAKLSDTVREGEQLKAALSRLRAPVALKEHASALGLVSIEDASYAKPEAVVAFGEPLR